MKKVAVVAVIAMAMLLALIGCHTKKVTVDSISVTKSPKLIYAIDEEFDKGSGELTAKMSDNSSKLVPLTDPAVSITGFDSSALSNDVQVKITYGGKETTLTVKIVGVSAISVIPGSPPQLVYGLNATAFNAASGKLRVDKTDDTSETVDISKATISNFKTDVPGFDIPVTISYGGKSTTVYITVVDQAINSIAVTKDPDKSEYWTGEQFVAAGGEITVTPKTGAPYTVSMDNSEVKAKYNFSERGGSNVPNKTVTIQYRGHQTTFDVLLESKIEGILINTIPQQPYIVGERFYRSTGSIHILHHDKLPDILQLTNENIVPHVTDSNGNEVTGFMENGIALKGTYNVVLVYTGTDRDGSFSFESDPYTINVKESAASDVLAKFYELNDRISIDWNEDSADISGIVAADRGESGKIAQLFNAYTALTGAEKGDVQNYQSRIIGLAYAEKFMDLYKDAITVSQISLENSTYATAVQYENLLNTFSQVVADRAADFELFNSFGTVILRGGISSITVSSIREKISMSEIVADTLGTSITTAKRLFGNMQQVDFGSKPAYAYKFSESQVNLDSAHSELKTLLTLSNVENSRYLLGIMENWREGYLEIMLEYVYQKNNGNIKHADVVQILEKAPPLILLHMTEHSLRIVNYAQSMLFPSDQSVAPSYILFNTYYQQLRDLIEENYSRGFASTVVAYESHTLVKLSEETEDHYTVKFIYDTFKSTERYVMDTVFGSYYSPTGEIKAYLDIYFPILTRYVDTWYISNPDYQPGAAAYDEDSIAMRTGLHALSVWDQLVILNFFNEGLYFDFLSDYLESHFGGTSTAEYSLFETYTNIHVAYINYIVTTDDPETAKNEKEEFLDSLRSEITSFNTKLEGIAEKQRLEDYFYIEMGFVNDIENWLEETAMSKMPQAIQPIYNYIAWANSYYSNGALDLFASAYLQLNSLVEALRASNDTAAKNYFTGTAIDMVGGYTLEDAYQILDDNYNSFYIIDINEDSKEVDFYLNYMDFLHDMMLSDDYVIGNTEYEDALIILKNEFFSLSPEEAVRFVKSGHYIIDSILFNALIGPLMEKKFESQANAKDAYELLLNVVFFSLVYEEGYESLEKVKDSIAAYNMAYNKLAAASTLFESLAGQEIIFVQSLGQFFTELETGNAANYQYIELLSATRAKYSSSEIIASEAYMRELTRRLVELENTDPSEYEVVMNMPMFHDGVTVFGSVYNEAFALLRIHKIMYMSDDDQTLELYGFLADAIYKFMTDEDYTPDSNAWETDTLKMIADYKALSAIQQGMFYLFQTGYMAADEGMMEVNYLYYFIEEYFKAELGTTAIMVDAIRGATDSFVVFGLYLTGFFQYEAYLEVGADATKNCGKLTGTPKSNFEASVIGGIYSEYIAKYNTIKAAYDADKTGFNVLTAAEEYIKAIEGQKLANATTGIADITYLLRGYTAMENAYNVLLNPSVPAAQRNTFNALVYEGATFEAWRTTLTAAVNGIINTSEIGKLNIFLAKFIFVSNRFIDVGGGIALYGLTTSMYEGGEPLDDVGMLIAHYETLTQEQKNEIEESIGHVYRALLRYYYSYNLNTLEYLNWYDTFTGISA